jgi:predicted CXXCH cytochrome family protein
MPRQGPNGEGLCLNCHEPHASNNPFDLLVQPYLSIGGHESVGPPTRYALCFSCHGAGGPGGMDYENTLIADFYDAGLNGESAGHQIRMNPDIAISWPAHIQAGDMLPCYDCHNPHGSEGYNAVQPNGYLISDQRRGWSDLTDTINDAEQCRTFCFGCHIPSDGIPGSQEVEGIVMNTIPDRNGHRTLDTQSCYQCHGNDYRNPRSHNVHNPKPGSGP